MASQYISDQQTKQIDPDISRVARKSPVDGHDMQRFFGTYLRPKAFIDLPPKVCKEGPAPKPRSTVASHDLGLPHEVVEAILSHLPTFDLIVATGINMTFRTIIQNSPMLQRKLFLRSTQEPARYVRVEYPDYGCRTIVAEASAVDVDEYDDGEDSREKHDGEAYDSDDSELDFDWQWSHELAVVDLCPFLLHRYCGDYSRSVRNKILYEAGEKVHFSASTAFAEHWADMYLTNPPTTQVIAHMSYRDALTGQCRIFADRTVYCESGVTIASLLDVLNMKGDVKITRGARRWASCLPDDMVGVGKNTTLSREIEDLQERDDLGFPLSNIELYRLETVIEFPGIVFREWRATSDEYYVRAGEDVPSYRECHVTAEEEALHG